MIVKNEMEMKQLGQLIGSNLLGGEMIELIGDIGAGKTTLTKGMALGLEISEPIQSPTFTISRIYNSRDDLTLYHYDFYRLGEAGLMTEDISEAIDQPETVVVVEWSGAVSEVLPQDRLKININVTNDDFRQVDIKAGGEKSRRLLEKIK